MNSDAYMDMLKQRLAHFFDEKPIPSGSGFDYAAELNARDEGYFFVPSMKTYSVSHNEYIYLKIVAGELSAASAEQYTACIREQMKNLRTTTEHMSSLFSAVFICSRPVSPETEQAIRKIKFHKDYAFTLKGWSDLAVFAISTSEEKIICNKAGEKTLQYYKFPS